MLLISILRKFYGLIWFVLCGCQIETFPNLNDSSLSLKDSPSFNAWLKRENVLEQPNETDEVTSSEQKPLTKETELIDLHIADENKNLKQVGTLSEPSGSGAFLPISDIIVAAFGVLNYRRGKYEEAANHFSRAIEINNKKAKYFRNRALCYLERQNYTKKENSKLAIEDLKKALELDNDYLPGHYFLGAVLFCDGKYEESINTLNKALQTVEKTDDESYKKKIINLLKTIRQKRKRLENKKKKKRKTDTATTKTRTEPEEINSSSK